MARTELSPTMIDAVAVTVDDLGRLLEHTDELDRSTAAVIAEALGRLMCLTRPSRTAPQPTRPNP